MKGRILWPWNLAFTIKSISASEIKKRVEWYTGIFAEKKKKNDLKMHINSVTTAKPRATLPPATLTSRLHCFVWV